jgi:hypothetical protein
MADSANPPQVRARAMFGMSAKKNRMAGFALFSSRL